MGSKMNIAIYIILLIIHLEFQFHSLESGGGLDVPDATILSHFHHRGAKIHLECLEKLLVLISRSPLEFSLERIHLDIWIWNNVQVLQCK